MVTITHSPSRIIKVPELSEFDYSVNAVEQLVQINAGTTSDTVVQDANVRRTTLATIDNQFVIELYSINGSPDLLANCVLEVIGNNGSLTGNVVSRISDGSCRILVKHSWLTRSVTVDLVRTTGQFDAWLSYVNGSLAKNVYELMYSLANGKNSTHLPMFSTQNHGSASYIRNPNCWAGSIDLTCVSPWNSAGTTQLCATLISPRHYICAAHAAVPVGATVRFVTTDNTTVERTVTAIVSNIGYDTCVGVLNADVPNSISFAKVLPTNFREYIPTHTEYEIPVISIDQTKKALVKRILSVDYNFSLSPDKWLMSFGGCTAAAFSTLNENIIGGDSGHPSFLVVNGEACILTCWTGSTNGAAYNKMHTELNAAMTSLGGGYQLTIADLSSFTSY